MFQQLWPSVETKKSTLTSTLENYHFVTAMHEMTREDVNICAYTNDCLYRFKPKNYNAGFHEANQYIGQFYNHMKLSSSYQSLEARQFFLADFNKINPYRAMLVTQ